MACNCTKIIEMQVENEKLMKTMESVISNFKEENERLTIENAELKTQGIDWMRMQLNDIIIRQNKILINEKIDLEKKNEELKTENECFKNCADTLIELQQKYSLLLKENEKSKRENEFCSCKSNLTEYEISGWINCDCSWCKTVCSPELIKFLDKKYKLINQLEEENIKLKTQLQNSDKPSQVERKLHKCQHCFNLMNNCAVCNGTGIVGESSSNPKTFEVVHGFCNKPVQLEIKDCPDCDGSGRVWCLTCSSTGIIVESKL